MFYLVTALAAVVSGRKGDCATIPDTSRIQAIGEFSDMRYTEEHAYGHIVQLWRAGSCVFGFLEVSEGLAGDTPLGELTKVRYDPRTGELGFTVKLTTGITMDRDSKTWVPSRDLFVFTGHLGSKVLKGQLFRSDQLTAGMRPVGEDVVLNLDSEQNGFTIEAGTYGDWRARAESILRLRGPKW